ncbi:MAG: hypothetical protein CK425_09260 [Parachlamydia sp.]|nr:MAG: hypothetical protein CK425_09260 [Parachlamydia sp.]
MSLIYLHLLNKKINNLNFGFLSSEIQSNFCFNEKSYFENKASSSKLKMPGDRKDKLKIQVKSLQFILLIAFICVSFQMNAFTAAETSGSLPRFVTIETENSLIEINKPENHREESKAQVTEKFCQRFQKLNHEIRHYGTLLSEKLLTCSYFQDTWLGFLHEAENVEDYHRGMQLFENHTNSFHNICRYITTIFNFYTGDYQTPTPQLVEVNFEGENVVGFLNTFKMGRDLSAEEREDYFFQEKACYLRDALVAPFILDATTLKTLQEETIYNFVLLPDGTVHVALEEPGNKAYHVHNQVLIPEAFHYPNHTILAGSPHQAVISAGSFILYRVEEKQLFFISCKSGHFQPNYDSLIHLRTQLAKLGIHPATLISVPNVDMSQVILKRYNAVQIPLSVTSKDAKNLFQIAYSQWEEIYPKINKSLLNALALCNDEGINPENIEAIHRSCEAAKRMSAAFNLFNSAHVSPKKLRQLIKCFGKLRDGIKHNVPKKIQGEATKVLKIMESYEKDFKTFDLCPADDASFYGYMKNLITSMEDLLNHSLLANDYRFLKKKSRELGVLFYCLSQDSKWKGKGYLIYHNASKAFFKINKKIAAAHGEYKVKLRHKEVNLHQDACMQPLSKIIDDLKKHLKQLGLLPIHYTIDVDPQIASCMINSAKDWYLSHAYFLFKHYDDAEDPLLSSLFLNIAKGNIPKSTFSKELEQLKCLKRDAEVARNALIFLDVQHQAPESIHHYIKNLNHIIQGIKNNDLERVKEEANFMLNLDRFPTLALEEWQCTTAEGFIHTLNGYLSCLHQFVDASHISKEAAEVVFEKVQAIQDLMNLFRRNGLSRSGDLPMVCYDSLEEHAERLLKEIQDAVLHLKEEEFFITPSMVFHAHFMLSRISKNTELTLQETFSH